MFKKIIAKWSQLHIAKKFAIVMICALFLSLLLELGYNLKVMTLDSADKGRTNVELSKMRLDNMKYDNSTLVCNEGIGSLTYDVDSYVDKLMFSYDKTYDLQAVVTVKYYNTFNMLVTKTIQDHNPGFIHNSVINIRENVKSVTITFSNDTGDLKINSMEYKNAFHFNYLRFGFWMLLFISTGMVIIFRKTFSSKLEYAFLTVGLCAGVLIILILPVTRVGFDEATHLRGSFLLSFQSETKGNYELWQMISESENNTPVAFNQSSEEYDELFTYLNDHALYYGNDTTMITTPRYTSNMATFGYLIIAFVINIARLFKTDFGVIYVIARFTSLATYLTVMFMAIRRLNKGKLLMVIIGLMPTAMYISSTVSYDPVVTSFIYLGMAYLISEFLEPEKKISMKEYMIYVMALSFGSLSKAVYIPLILIGLFLPADKFRDKKTERFMKIGIILIFCILMSTFVIPEIISPDEVSGGGGDKSDASQVSIMLSNPLSYAKVLLYSIKKELFNFFIGEEGLDNMYLMGRGNKSCLIIMFLTFIVFTHSRDEKQLKPSVKVWILILIFVVICLINTAMYLCFTSPGMTSISGVQGRYFIPLLFPLLMVLSTNRVKCNLNITKYNTLAVLISIYIVFSEIYTCLLVPCAF